MVIDVKEITSVSEKPVVNYKGIMEAIGRLETLSPLSKEERDAYSSKIIDDIDSGLSFEVPGQRHRAAHEFMWMITHKITQGIDNRSEASTSFFSEQRHRFNIWYAWRYVLPLEEKSNSYFSKTCLSQAQRSSLDYFGIDVLAH